VAIETTAILDDCGLSGKLEAIRLSEQEEPIALSQHPALPPAAVAESLKALYARIAAGSLVPSLDRVQPPRLRIEVGTLLACCLLEYVENV
jgi:hypothetical protein